MKDDMERVLLEQSGRLNRGSVSLCACLLAAWICFREMERGDPGEKEGGGRVERQATVRFSPFALT